MFGKFTFFPTRQSLFKLVQEMLQKITKTGERLAWIRFFLLLKFPTKIQSTNLSKSDDLKRIEKLLNKIDSELENIKKSHKLIEYNNFLSAFNRVSIIYNEKEILFIPLGKFLKPQFFFKQQNNFFFCNTIILFYLKALRDLQSVFGRGGFEIGFSGTRRSESNYQKNR